MKLSSRSLYGCIIFLKMYFFQYLSFLKIGLNNQDIKLVILQSCNIKPTLFPLPFLQTYTKFLYCVGCKCVLWIHRPLELIF